MEWLEWNDATFARARELDRPVLLFVHASWCRFCRELEATVLCDPRVERLLGERFVCIAVDKDRRPDLDARYSKGGWPTLAWLDDAGVLLANDTYLDLEPFVQRLEVVAAYYAREREAIRSRSATFHVEEPAPVVAEKRAQPATLSLEIVEHVTRTIVESADPVFGGWGREHKFPHTEALDFALIRWSQTGDDALLQLVLRTLRGMQQGEIHDTVEGGFYRYATQPDWSVPNHEKVLDSNAQRLCAYLEAWQVFGDQSFERTARGIVEFLERVLLDAKTGAFKGSQDAQPTYAHLATRAERAAFGAPKCDPTIFAGWNAMTVSALLKSASVLHEERLRVRALTTLDFLVAELFDARRGMDHYWSDGGSHLPGLLVDQAYTLRALVDAAQFAGETRYLATARALADLSIEHLRSPTGGFWDTAYDPHARGGLRRRDRSILDNAVMAEALLRLSALVRDDDYAETAREALASFAGDYKRYGHFVAGYARAVDLLFHTPIHVTIVGARHAPTTRALVDAALRPYVASRIVQVLDPSEDRELLQRALPHARVHEHPRAYVARGRESYAETADAARLAALMTRVERGGDA